MDWWVWLPISLVTRMPFVNVGVVLCKLAIVIDTHVLCIPSTVFPNEAGMVEKVTLQQWHSISGSGSIQAIRW